MIVRPVTALILAALLTMAPAATRTPARRFLMDALHVSAADIARLDRGEVVSTTLEPATRREVATLGVVRIATSPARYVERLTDIPTFKRTEGIIQIGTFSATPRESDVATLTIEDADLKRLRGCEVERCGVQFSADAIERIQRNVDWRAPDASSTASRLVRQLLANYAADYVHRGSAAAMEYADDRPRLNVATEFASLIGADPVTAHCAPLLRQHLLEYPASPAGDGSDLLYWSKELIRGRPVISITHVAIVPGDEASPVAYAIGSKQIYAMHYYDASFGLTLLVPDREAATPTTYVIYLNRSRIDLFDGLVGGVARRIVAGKARGLVADQLHRLQRVLADDGTQAKGRED